MSGSAESVQMEEVRQRAQSLLSSSGLAQDVKAEVLTLASISLPVSEKYRHLTAEEMLKENTAGRNNIEASESLSRLVKALSILEKYGCNLTSPTRPRYWRSVKHNNPVFRTTVDAIKGGRRVLFLYGYTNQQIDGLSFPDEVTEPDCDVVAAVTLEVMTLRTEVDMLLKDVHPHPECFKDIIPGLTLQKEQTDDSNLPGDDGQGEKPQAPLLLVKPTPLPRQTQVPKPPADESVLHNE